MTSMRRGIGQGSRRVLYYNLSTILREFLKKILINPKIITQFDNEKVEAKHERLFNDYCCYSPLSV
jgi:hypothetical protein